jgi:hypothetical protein
MAPRDPRALDERERGTLKTELLPDFPLGSMAVADEAGEDSRSASEHEADQVFVPASLLER